mgnify:CR=1 FL=1
MLRDYSIDSEKKKIIYETYKQQRSNINFLSNECLITKYCTFNKRDNFWNLFEKLKIMLQDNKIKIVI